MLTNQKYIGEYHWCDVKNDYTYLIVEKNLVRKGSEEARGQRKRLSEIFRQPRTKALLQLGPADRVSSLEVASGDSF